MLKKKSLKSTKHCLATYIVSDVNFKYYILSGIQILTTYPVFMQSCKGAVWTAVCKTKDSRLHTFGIFTLNYTASEEVTNCPTATTPPSQDSALTLGCNT